QLAAESLGCGHREGPTEIPVGPVVPDFRRAPVVSIGRPAKLHIRFEKSGDFCRSDYAGASRLPRRPRPPNLLRSPPLWSMCLLRIPDFPVLPLFTPDSHSRLRKVTYGCTGGWNLR